MPEDWKNVDLNSHEIESDILSPISFGDLLLCINCNIKDINYVTIAKQFEELLEAKIEESKETFKDNINNIFKKAILTRYEDAIIKYLEANHDVENYHDFIDLVYNYDDEDFYNFITSLSEYY